MNNTLRSTPYDPRRNYSLPEKPTIRVENYHRTGANTRSAICAVVLSHFNLRLNGISIDYKGGTTNVVIPDYFAWKKFGMADRSAAVEIPDPLVEQIKTTVLMYHREYERSFGSTTAKERGGSNE